MGDNDFTGADLKATRERSGLTQQEVADRLGHSRQTLVSWESRAMVAPTKAIRYLRAVWDLADEKGTE
jgi:DNA-binding transcriptional regulator YiaG